MKQSKGLSGDLKAEHKCVRGRPSETDWAGSCHIVWEPTHRRAIKKESDQPEWKLYTVASGSISGSATSR